MMSKPAKCIPVDSAKALQDNWVATRQPEIERTLGHLDTREFFYSLGELEDFLNYVKDESKKQGITNPGIRIYFGAYNNDKSNKATVFLAPTKGDDKNSDNNYDISPFNMNQGGWPPKNY